MAGTLTAAIAAAFSGSAVTPDPYYEYTTLLLPGNGTNGAQNNTFLDGSTNNFTITRNGNTTQGTFSPFSQTGWGNYTAGSVSGASRIDVAGTSGLFGTNVSYTIEGWFNFITPSVTDNTNIIATNTNTYPSRWVIDANVTSSLINLRIITESNAILYSGSTVSYSLGSWVHLAIVNDNAANTLTFYINGQAAGTRAKVSLGSYATLNLLNQYGVASAVPFYASNFRITNGQALYSTNFTPSTVPLTTTSQGATAGNVALLTFQSNRFVDNSSSPKTLTVNGSNSVVAFSPFNPTASWSAATYGGSGYFDGNGDKLTLTTTSALSFGTNNWTIEFWVYRTDSNESIIYDGRSTEPQVSPHIQISPSGVALFYVNGAARITGTTVIANGWFHIVVSKLSGNTRLFVNGAQEGSTYPDSNNYTIGATLYIGGDYVGSANAYLNGYLSDLRVLNGTGYSTITVPTAPLTAITNTSLLLNFTNAGIYDATSKNDLETWGNAQISTTQSKWGGSSMSFNGTTDYLTSVASTLTNIGSGDFTIEAWFRTASVSTQQAIVNIWGSTPTQFQLEISSAGKLQFAWAPYSTSVYAITGATTLSANTWYYVAIVRSGSVFTLYLNGNSDGTLTSSATTTNNATVFIGANNSSSINRYFNGYMQDVRITRYARTITASPTAAFPTL